MSQVVDHIICEATGKRFTKQSPLKLEVNVIKEMLPHLHFLEEYRLMVKIAQAVRLPSDDLKSSKEEAIRLFKKGLIETLFGEFRSDFIKLQFCLYNDDKEEAYKTAKDIERRMFYE